MIPVPRRHGKLQLLLPVITQPFCIQDQLPGFRCIRIEIHIILFKADRIIFIIQRPVMDILTVLLADVVQRPVMIDIGEIGRYAAV